MNGTWLKRLFFRFLNSFQKVKNKYKNYLNVDKNASKWVCYEFNSYRLSADMICLDPIILSKKKKEKLSVPIVPETV